MKKILIIDDSKIIVDELKKLFLQKVDFEIYSEDNLEKIDSLLEKNDFFLLIVNYEFLERFNDLPTILENKKANTIILSKNIDMKIIKSMRNINVIDYILIDSLSALEKVYNLVDILLFTQGFKVLLVEDGSENTKQIKQALQNLMFKVLSVKNGLDAIKTISLDSSISLIISDYDIEYLNGLELTKTVRSNKFYANVPIIILSDGKGLDLKVNLFKNGIDDYMIRPIVPEVFKTKVINIFSNKKYIEEINTFYRIFDENIIASSTDPKGLIKNVSKAFCKISGYSKEELIGKHHNIVRHPDMPKSIYQEMWKTIKDGKVWKGDIKNLRKDGTSYWVSTIIEPIFDKFNEISGYEAVRQDITDKKRIYELSIKDGLTNVFNRRYFNDIAQEEINDSARNNKTFAFLLLDIDNFKKYNDTYGHQKGDDVLISVANSLKSTFKRSDDKVFRLGGEEFGVLINTNEESDIYNLAQDAKRNIELLNIEHKENLSIGIVSASIGLAIISLEIKDRHYNLDYIYKLADEQLYKAKANGRNRIESCVIYR